MSLKRLLIEIDVPRLCVICKVLFCALTVVCGIDDEFFPSTSGTVMYSLGPVMIVPDCDGLVRTPTDAVRLSTFVRTDLVKSSCLQITTAGVGKISAEHASEHR